MKRRIFSSTNIFSVFYSKKKLLSEQKNVRGPRACVATYATCLSHKNGKGDLFHETMKQYGTKYMNMILLKHTLSWNEAQHSRYVRKSERAIAISYERSSAVIQTKFPFKRKTTGKLDCKPFQRRGWNSDHVPYGGQIGLRTHYLRTSVPGCDKPIPGPVGR